MPFALLGGPYGLFIKYGVILLVGLGLFCSGYYRGYHSATTAQKARVVEHVLVQMKYLPQETKYIHDAVGKVQAAHDKAVANVQTLPDNRVCDVPADTLGLLNANRALPAVH